MTGPSGPQECPSIVPAGSGSGSACQGRSDRRDRPSTERTRCMADPGFSDSVGRSYARGARSGIRSAYRQRLAGRAAPFVRHAQAIALGHGLRRSSVPRLCREWHEWKRRRLHTFRKQPETERQSDRAADHVGASRHPEGDPHLRHSSGCHQRRRLVSEPPGARPGLACCSADCVICRRAAPGLAFRGRIRDPRGYEVTRLGRRDIDAPPPVVTRKTTYAFARASLTGARGPEAIRR